MASWLMADAPGAFEIVTDKPAAKALQAPAVDKMIGKAPRSK